MKQSLNKGFTFIELLIALTIFSVMAASIYYAFNTGIKVWSRENSMILENQKVRVFLDVISLDMKNAVFYSGIESEWRADKVSFPTSIKVFKEDYAGKELAKVSYRFDVVKGELSRVCSVFKEESGEKYGTKEVLLDNLEDFIFEYCYEPPAPDDEYIWKDKWEPDNKIPRGIRIKFTLNNEKENILRAFNKTVFIPIGELGKEGE